MVEIRFSKSKATTYEKAGISYEEGWLPVGAEREGLRQCRAFVTEEQLEALIKENRFGTRFIGPCTTGNKVSLEGPLFDHSTSYGIYVAPRK